MPTAGLNILKTGNYSCFLSLVLSFSQPLHAGMLIRIVMAISDDFVRKVIFFLFHELFIRLYLIYFPISVTFALIWLKLNGTVTDCHHFNRFLNPFVIHLTCLERVLVYIIYGSTKKVCYYYYSRFKLIFFFIPAPLTAPLSLCSAVLINDGPQWPWHNFNVFPW